MMTSRVALPCPAVPEKAYFCANTHPLKQKFRYLLQTVLPQNRTETFLLLIFLMIYGTLASYIAWNYRIIFDDRIPWDAYFSFDNRAIVMTGGGYERHPLANYFFNWLRELALLISGGQKDAVFRLVLGLCSAITVSFSLLQVYKYLRNIIRLPDTINFLLVAFMAFFSTTILLSFTPETYTYTLLSLILFNYYAALKLRKEQEIPWTAFTLAAVSIGGLTITNIVKVYIPALFQKAVFKKPKAFGRTALRIFISAVVFMFLFLSRIDFKWMQFLNKSGQQYDKFSNPKVTPVWDMVSSWFLGGNMLLSSYVVRDYKTKHGFAYKALFMDVYSSYLAYAFVAILLVLLLWAYVLNFKNKLVQILMLSFLIDVIIHAVLKFGLHTSYIYGGHFVFVFPLLLGWLFYSYRNKPSVLSGLFATVSALLLYLAVNNIYRMAEFFEFLNRYYI